MTVTDELRAMLDERGVEWKAYDEFEQWVESLRHDSIDSIRDAVEQLMYDVFEFGGNMGPNGNTYNGIDEGEVMTNDFIDSWVERFVELSARAVEE